MKRPPPPFPQAGVNGVKTQQASSSPPNTTQRLPGNMSAGPSPNLTNGVLNVANGAKGPLNRTRNMSQRPDPATRVTRGVARTSSLGNENRVGKRCPEPYGKARPAYDPQCLREAHDVLTLVLIAIAVKTTSYILKKYANCPPSLIVHLHPTHFRFEQQDGSFPYNSEMKVIIEHIRRGTVPHDLIEELLRSGVRFYEGSFRLQRLVLVVVLTVSS